MNNRFVAACALIAGEHVDVNWGPAMHWVTEMADELCKACGVDPDAEPIRDAARVIATSLPHD